MNAIIVQQERRDRTTSAVTTVIVHALLAVLFLFIGLTEFDPPIPEQVVEIEMEGGGGEVGGGDPQPVETMPAAPSAADETPEDVATDEENDVEVVKPPVKRPDPKPVKKPPTETPKVDRRLENALQNWNTPAENPNPKPTENPNPGGGGAGKGLFQGNGWELRGNGPGSGGGSGGGRGLSRGPDLSERPPLQNPTWVEVKVVVDPAGNVLRVSIGNTGTPDIAIQNVALRAAKTCRFVAVAGAPPEQVHYIKLRFVPG